MSIFNRFLSTGYGQPTGREYDPNAEIHQRNAFRISLATAIVMGLISVAGLVINLTTSAGNLPAVFIAVAMVVVSAVSAVLSRRSNYIIAIMILTGGAILAELLLPFLIDQASIMVGIILTLLIFGIAVNTLPNKYVAGVFIPTVLAGMAGIVMDLFLPIDVPGLTTSAMSWFTVLFVVIYGGLIFRQFKNFPLQGKLVISFAMVALVPLAVLVWMNTTRVTQLLEENVRQELSETAQQDAEVVDRFIKTQMDSIRLEAQLQGIVRYVNLAPRERAGSEAEAEAIETLTTLSRKDPIYVVSYALMDADGWVILDTVTDNAGQNDARQPYFATPLETGLPYVSPVLFINDIPNLFFSSPIRGESGRTIGVLRVTYNASVLQSLLTSSAGALSSQSIYSVLIDDEHYIRLAHSIDPFLLYKAYAPLTPSLATRLQSENRLPEGSLENLTTNQPGIVAGIQNIGTQSYFTASTQASALAGNDALTTAKHLQEAPWIILVRQSTAVAQAPIEGQMRSSVMLALLAIVLVTGVAVMVSQVISSPIMHLTQVAEKVAGGNLEVRSQVTTDDEIGALARTFNTMTDELQETLQNLEQRVADRTKALELSSGVSRRLSTILDPVKLVSEVVNSLQSTFNYYHAQIYLFDDRKENLVMVGGTGEAGQVMLERGHSIPHGRGLVGRACEIGAEILVPDTVHDPNWLSNPLLPETRAEIAVPIMAGKEVLGALDVQQNEVNSLGQQDADLLRSIASQVAIALQNANQFTQARHRAERERTITAIIQQIQNTHSVPDALQVAARELGRALHVPRIRTGLTTVADENGRDSSQPELDK